MSHPFSHSIQQAPDHADHSVFPPFRYVWLVPQYTNDPDSAVTSFQIDIQSQENPDLDDLAKGAGGDYRYLLSAQDITQINKVIEVGLLRSDQEVPSPPDGWDGQTIDINKSRGKTYLYLLWKTASAE